ncbi:MAG: STAS/SEC14 domain-containing protein [Cyclobacteriaceae bacterium]|nr:STAS/SEC14 domain-containing protein [Cyclobacteriaceae bacterium]MCH8516509.1 STAS/SEC14 domain-containing protein [Cyclobacteriaceae bacterium]
MEKYATFERLNSAIVRITFTGAKGTEENFGAYLQENLSLYDAKKPVCLLYDASDASLPSASLQKMQADWLKKHEQLMKGYCLGTAYVIPSAVVRTVLKAIFALQKQPIEYAIFKDMPAALKWCEERTTLKDGQSVAD